MSVTIVNNMKECPDDEETEVLDWPVGTCGYDENGDPIVRTVEGAVTKNYDGKVITVWEETLQRGYSGIINPSGTCTITFN